MNSMTGYGRGTARCDAIELVVELSSVNRRNLEVQVSVPKDWLGVERMLTDKIRSTAGRGKVYLQLKIQEYSEADTMAWDESRIKAALEKLRALAESEGIKLNIDGGLLFQVASSMSREAETPDWEPYENLIMEAADEAIQKWIQMRAAEGAELKNDLVLRCGLIRGWVDAIREHSGNTVSEYRDKLYERLRQAGLDLDVSDERVLKEIALFADRCDISEELTRLESHFTMLTDALESDGLVGRKLDFICQEIYRELNTIGSKGNNMEISRLVIDCKNEWERLREQAANVE